MYSICTAGHVNHGKTSLVRELTGIETDRLKEEKQRGLSIELGFAKYSFNKNLYASIIDTPGHESFIRNMISGAHAVDLVLLTVAANEGIKPQTIEHLNILKLLSIDEIVLVITKIDLVNNKELSNLKNELKKFLSNNSFDNLDIIEISTKEKIGIDN
ncbi:MAG: GTP-binding protein, partial [Chloroflexota bacterium]|nr:GTP-binding protein [Chloroflexota bacterium]